MMNNEVKLWELYRCKDLLDKSGFLCQDDIIVPIEITKMCNNTVVKLVVLKSSAEYPPSVLHIDYFLQPQWLERITG